MSYQNIPGYSGGLEWIDLNHHGHRATIHEDIERMVKCVS